MKRYSLNIKRILVNIFILLLLMLLINIIYSFTLGSKHFDTKSILVNSNDTLWSIANNICADSDEDLNIQNIIIEIKNINNLKGSTIYSGQELNIPIYN